MNSQEVHPVPIYLTPKQLKWRLKAADIPHWYNLAPFSQPHQGVPSWQDPVASLPLEKAHSILRKKRKRKAVADPWNIFLKFIPPIFFCFILSGKHSPLAAMHTIPRSLWANRNEVETGGLSQRVLAVWSVLVPKAELFPAALHTWAPPVLGAASRRMAGQHQTYSWQCLWLLGLLCRVRRVWTEQTSTERSGEGCCVGAGNREEISQGSSEMPQGNSAWTYRESSRFWSTSGNTQLRGCSLRWAVGHPKLTYKSRQLLQIQTSK